jgi:hypothetical protein
VDNITLILNSLKWFRFLPALSDFVFCMSNDNKKGFVSGAGKQ